VKILDNRSANRQQYSPTQSDFNVLWGKACEIAQCCQLQTTRLRNAEYDFDKSILFRANADGEPHCSFTAFYSSEEK
jgi:hypothetical protein